jgi:hypothetical protein
MKVPFMSDLQTLRDCFKDLSNDLFNIRYYPRYELPCQESVIKAIIDGDILKCDLENIQQYLQKYLKDLDTLKLELPTIIDGQPPEVIYRPYPPNYPLDRDPDPAKELESFLSERLSYYKTEFTKVLSHIEEMEDQLGSDRFASAGFKLRLNLTHQEIAFLFKALLDAKMLSMKDGSPLSKKNLAKFISSNFTSPSASVAADVISASNLVNLLSQSYDGDAEKLFKNLSKAAKQ